MNTKIDKSLILNKIKSHYEYKTDADFANFLGIKPQTLSSWHSRNTFDIELIYAKCELISGDYILSGKGSILRKDYLLGPIKPDDREIKRLEFINRTQLKEIEDLREKTKMQNELLEYKNQEIAQLKKEQKPFVYPSRVAESEQKLKK